MHNILIATQNTNQNGEYNFPGLAEGYYRVQVADVAEVAQLV